MMCHRIRELRENRHLSQWTVAQRLGIHQTTYSGYEHGSNIPLATLVKLADFYQISVDYILKRTDQPQMYPPNIQQYIS